MGTQGICRASFHCAYQGGRTLIFGKGTTVSVSSSKYLVMTDYKLVLILQSSITQGTKCLLILLTQRVLGFSDESP